MSKIDFNIYGLQHLILNLQSADPNDPACENSGICHDCVNHKSICQAHIVRKLQFFGNYNERQVGNFWISNLRLKTNLS